MVFRAFVVHNTAATTTTRSPPPPPTCAKLLHDHLEGQVQPVAPSAVQQALIALWGGRRGGGGESGGADRWEGAGEQGRCAG